VVVEVEEVAEEELVGEEHRHKLHQELEHHRMMLLEQEHHPPLQLQVHHHNQQEVVEQEVALRLVQAHQQQGVVV